MRLNHLLLSCALALSSCNSVDKAADLLEGVADVIQHPPTKSTKTVGLAEGGPDGSSESIDCDALKKKIDKYVLADEREAARDQLPIDVKPEPGDDDKTFRKLREKHGARLAPLWNKIKNTVRACDLTKDSGMSGTSALCVRALARLGTDGAK